MSRKHILFILNPAAGAGNPQPVYRALDDHLRHHHIDLHETTADEDITAVVTDRLESETYDWVMAAGGDGTVSLVADAIAEKEVPLGIVPLGTANGLAADLGLPADVAAACRMLAGNPSVRPIDALRVGEQNYVLLRLGAGMITRVLMETNRAEKNRIGIVAYYKNLLQQLGDPQPRPLRLTIDGRVQELEMTELMVINSPGLGGGTWSWGDHIRPDDGRIDVCAIHLDRVQDYATVVWNILTGEAQENENVRYFTASESVCIETADAPLDVAGDGELLGQTPVEIEVASAAVPVLVPS